MKNVKSLVVGALVVGGLFLTSCQSSKSGCYYSESKIEQPAPLEDQTVYAVKCKAEAAE